MNSTIVPYLTARLFRVRSVIMVPTLALFLALYPACPAIARAVDHTKWSRVLDQYVDSRGFVDYQGLADDRIEFDAYIAAIQTGGPETSPEDYPDRASQLAYYLNAYNAMVFKGVLDRGPERDSVWSGLISGLNFFVRMDITVDGRTTSLKNLEDEVVRARFGDPRIHAALNCASVGCPRLIHEAYNTELLEQQLEAAVVEFVNSPQHVKVEAEQGRVGLSKIFDWYEEDFVRFESRAGNGAGGVSEKLISYVNRYRSEANQIPTDLTVYILDYDKAINQQ